MKPSEVLFLAGDVKRLGSVKIRCREIASRLGCDCFYGARSAQDVPRGYKAFLCVKPDFSYEEVREVANKGLVIWDIIDAQPPQKHVGVYLTSTRYAAKMFSHLGQVEIIPHYHCNFENRVVPIDLRRPAYIGSAQWYPSMDGIDHDTHFVERCSREEVAGAYLQTGIAINMRLIPTQPNTIMTAQSVRRVDAELHVALNSGIKMINCIGFGLPSVASAEPAFMEVGKECAIFATLKDAPAAVTRLQWDHELYTELRESCLERRRLYDINEVVHIYRRFIRAL